MEEWKDIEWFNGLYQISNLGRVKSNKYSKEKILKNLINKVTWYVATWLWWTKRFYIHRLIALHFLDKKEWFNEVNHIDGNKLNNILSNIEWSNRSMNNIHKYRVLWSIPWMKWKKWNLNIFSKPILQYTKEWIFIREYQSISECATINNFVQSNISKWLIKWKFSYWYMWKYKLIQDIIQ